MRSASHYGTFFERVLRATVDAWAIDSGRDALRRTLSSSRRIVFALNHGPPHAPLIPVAALGTALIEDGAGDRRIVGITFRGLYAVPGLGAAVRWLTQVDAPPRFDALLADLTADRFDHVVIMPEGHHCVFGDPSEVQRPASPRFVELAVRGDAALVLVAHRGTETWARSVVTPRSLRRARWPHLVSRSIGAALVREGTLALPSGTPRIKRLRMAIETFVPSLDRATFESLPIDAQRRFVESESARAWGRLRAMHADLAEDRPHERPSPT